MAQAQASEDEKSPSAGSAHTSGSPSSPKSPWSPVTPAIALTRRTSSAVNAFGMAPPSPQGLGASRQTEADDAAFGNPCGEGAASPTSPGAEIRRNAARFSIPLKLRTTQGEVAAPVPVRSVEGKVMAPSPTARALRTGPAFQAPTAAGTEAVMQPAPPAFLRTIVTPLHGCRQPQAGN